MNQDDLSFEGLECLSVCVCVCVCPNAAEGGYPPKVRVS